SRGLLGGVASAAAVQRAACSELVAAARLGSSGRAIESRGLLGGVASAAAVQRAADARNRRVAGGVMGAVEGRPLDEERELARRALACRYLLELDEAETAAALGVRRGTVKSRVSRALDRLRESYD